MSTGYRLCGCKSRRQKPPDGNDEAKDKQLISGALSPVGPHQTNGCYAEQANASLWGSINTIIMKHTFVLRKVVWDRLWDPILNAKWEAMEQHVVMDMYMSSPLHCVLILWAHLPSTSKYVDVKYFYLAE